MVTGIAGSRVLLAERSSVLHRRSLMRILAIVLLFVVALPLGLAKPNGAPEQPPEKEKGVNDQVQLALNTGGHTAPIHHAFFAAKDEQLITLGQDRTVQV